MAQESEATTFKMRTELLDQGRTDKILAKTDRLEARIKVYASGGENGLHTHPNEDHLFIVMQGSARYYGPDGSYTDVSRHEGIMLPAGAYYWFEATGSEPLVLVRVGAPHEQKDATVRLDIRGDAMAGNSAANKKVPTVIREGAFFE